MVTHNSKWRSGLVLGISMAAGLGGQAAVLQVTGTVSGGLASITGTLDTSGLGTNQVDVQFESLDPSVSRIWSTFEVVRPLIWNGAAREGNTFNYWDVWAGNYYGHMYLPEGGDFQVNTSGTLMTYQVGLSLASQPPSDIIAVRGHDVSWSHFGMPVTGCMGYAHFELASGEIYEEYTFEKLAEGYLEGVGHLTTATIWEIEPDVWRFTWSATMTPEPSALLLGLLSVATLPRGRRRTAC